ncbi:hypothetical protein M422DRAFT_38562 [Sphaerobolus stellatus SS14]|uniref:Uncharacterized protein n=1 Tax=Sphaerobolus stellatus (strain SS14) TaxID=990650 RepID=A0A0C9T995_SPHS4|nr:hypothetical protein M422DRAFT_38562 [Sphaerobolus stellatus SS14]
MVWVINQSPGDITVHITNTSHGSAATYVITTNKAPYSGQNYWNRTGDETITVTVNSTGKVWTGKVKANDQVTVYDGTVVIIHDVDVQFFQ